MRGKEFLGLDYKTPYRYKYFLGARLDIRGGA